jgi:hypothetical protein
MSFGFKYGLPTGRRPRRRRAVPAQPALDPELRPGPAGPEVRDYVLGRTPPASSWTRYTDVLRLTGARLPAGGKRYLTLAVGCTGGSTAASRSSEEFARRLTPRARRRCPAPRPGPRVVGRGAAPRVVAFGGGHGLAAAAGRLAADHADLTAVVTVADDGGSVRPDPPRDAGPAPGDLRMALAALAGDGERSQELAALLQHRLGGTARSPGTRSAT